MSKDTSYETLRDQISARFAGNMAALRDLEKLKIALRIVNGVEDLEFPTTMSDAEKEEIEINAKGVSDAMAYVIHTCITELTKEPEISVDADIEVLTAILSGE